MKLWIRIDVAIRSDPNVAELASRLGVTLAEAVGLCTLTWAAIAEHRPNGALHGIAIPALEKWAGWERRKGKPAGVFGRAFRELFISDNEASGWESRQGKLVDRAERDRLRKVEERRRKSTDKSGTSTATVRNGTEQTTTSTDSADEFSRELITAANSGMTHNPAIGDALNPIPFGHGASVSAAEAIQHAGVDSNFAVAVVFEMAEHFEPASRNRQIKSLGYCTDRVIEQWNSRAAQIAANGAPRPAARSPSHRATRVSVAEQGYTNAKLALEHYPDLQE